MLSTMAYTVKLKRINKNTSEQSRTKQNKKVDSEVWQNTSGFNEGEDERKQSYCVQHYFAFVVPVDIK